MKRLEYLARVLALLWSGFWTFFFMAESLAWHTPLGRMIVWVAVGLAFVILSLVAWRWEMVGGLVLIGVGTLAALAYGIWGPRELSVTTRVTILFGFSVPPMFAGALFLMHHRSSARLGGARS